MWPLADRRCRPEDECARSRAGAFVVISLLLLAACQTAPRGDALRYAAPEPDPAYPIHDPYAATVVGTPPTDTIELPREVPVEVRSLPRLTDRPVPEILWYEDRFRYALAAQSGEAPLVIIVPGTNAGWADRYSVFLQKMLWASGYHVASLPSPTYPNFMVTASSTGVPGRTSQDATDLYRAMQAVLRDVEAQVPVSNVSVVGYSLGAWQSAFVAEEDAREGAIGLRRVLLINPPVSLWRSSRRLDAMLNENVPGGADGIDAFIDRTLYRFTEVYQSSGGGELDGAFLYRAYAKLDPGRQGLAALVGLAFRVSSSNIAFTADVLSRSGYIVPPDRELGIGTSLTPYFDKAMRRGFERYFEDLLYPYYHARDPSLTEEQMIEESSLERVGPFLATASNVGMVGTADDVILAPGDLLFLATVFGDRAWISRYGGHCGSLQSRDAVAAMVRFLAS